MTQEQSKQIHTIISYFQARYKEKFNRRPIVNRNKLQWTVGNILQDLSMKEIKTLIDFYIRTDKNPSLMEFCYEYDEILDRMNLESVDLENRKALMRKTEESVIEFRKRYGNAGK